MHRCFSSHNRSTSGLLLCAIYMHRVHHMQGGADEVTELLTAALTASIHANRPCQRAAMPTGVGLALMQLAPVAS